MERVRETSVSKVVLFFSPPKIGSSWHVIQDSSHLVDNSKTWLGLNYPFCLRIFMIYIQYICIWVQAMLSYISSDLV